MQASAGDEGLENRVSNRVSGQLDRVGSAVTNQMSRLAPLAPNKSVPLANGLPTRLPLLTACPTRSLRNKIVHQLNKPR